jgi:hypothetical protein
MDRELKELFKPVAWTLPIAVFVGPLVSLYRALVLQDLWNWFATRALQLPEISFWVMYGLVLVVGMFTANKSDMEQEQSFKVLTIAVDACMPDDKREWVRAQLDDLQSRLWIDIGFKIFGEILNITAILVIGWAVHRFLA